MRKKKTGPGLVLSLRRIPAREREEASCIVFQEIASPRRERPEAEEVSTTSERGKIRAGNRAG